jgi:hypothetical protein
MSDSKSAASKYQWFEDEMVWKRRKGRSRNWTVENPPLPDWAQQGGVTPASFVRLYQGASSLNEVKKGLFWMSLSEIEAMRVGISQWLAVNDIQPLDALPGTNSMFQSSDIQALLSEGVLSPVPGSALDHQLNPPPESSGDEPDLTPAPPRPNEDPLQGMTFNEIMHIPEAKNEKQFVTMMGMGKGLRITGKH